jgi:hypothetical protein
MRFWPILGALFLAVAPGCGSEGPGRTFQLHVPERRGVSLQVHDPSEHGRHGDGAVTTRTVVGAWAAATAITTGAFAQTPPPSDPVEPLAFDRPEAWALKYFISTTTLSGLDTPEGARTGSISLGLEGGWIPTLTATQQRVGFNGTAPQDLNKAPLMLRPRLTIGCTAGSR